MATINKTFQETSSSPTDTRSTWTVTWNTISITASGATFKLTPPRVAAKYVGKDKGFVYCKFTAYAYIGQTGGTPHAYWTNQKGTSSQLAQMASDTTYTIPLKDEGYLPTFNTGDFFNSSNPTTSAININLTHPSDTLTASYTKTDNALTYGSNPSHWTSTQSQAIGTIGSVRLYAPPTATVSQVTFGDSYHVAGHTTASVSISALEAKYGGTISSCVLKIGSQTSDSRTTNGTLSIDCSTVGTFTPTVTITDSRSQTRTYTLDPITVNAHTAPDVSATQISLIPSSYAGYSTAKTTISGATSYDGTTITDIKLTIGNLTGSRTDNGDIEVAMTRAGTFTPTVVITDSYGSTKTVTLNAITLKEYTPPEIAFSIERTDSAGKPDDEGTRVTAEATFTFVDALTTLQAPIVEVDNTTDSATWYTTRASDGTLSGAVDWSNLSSPATIYGIIGSTIDTEYSYQIGITPVDGKATGTEVTQTIASAFYTIDFKAGGRGIAFGQPCVQDGFWCGMDAHFTDIDLEAGEKYKIGGNDLSAADVGAVNVTTPMVELDTTTSSGTDYDLYTAITALGWQNDVIE